MRAGGGAAVRLLAASLLSWGCSSEQPSRLEFGALGPGQGDGDGHGPSLDVGFDVRFDILAVERGRLVRSPTTLARNPFRFGLSGQQRVLAGPPDLYESAGWSESPLDLSTWPDPMAAWSNPTPLEFIGVIEAPASAGRVAVLTDGDAVYHGRVGDALGAYARIVSVTPTSVELEPLGGYRYTLQMAP